MHAFNVLNVLATNVPSVSGQIVESGLLAVTVGEGSVAIPHCHLLPPEGAFHMNEHAARQNSSTSLLA